MVMHTTTGYLFAVGLTKQIDSRRTIMFNALVKCNRKDNRSFHLLTVEKYLQREYRNMSEKKSILKTLIIEIFQMCDILFIKTTREISHEPALTKKGVLTG